MSSIWQTVRVFISSTFRDMHSEPDWLVKRAFPLREQLEKYRVHLIDIDGILGERYGWVPTELCERVTNK